MRNPDLEYGAPLTMEEIEALRCLIDAHLYAPSKWYPEFERRCINCDKEEV